ncbi:hypothetical protein L0152_11615 [bacterium]|nr:hypothetical protein [bacterium]
MKRSEAGRRKIRRINNAAWFAIMITASELAGFFAAHAIWCVSDGETLIPMLAYIHESGERKMERLDFDDFVVCVDYGKERLLSNDMNADDAALLYDGRIPIGATKLDAIVIEVKTYFSPKSEFVIAVPYTLKSSGRFLVHRPKILGWNHCEDFDMNAVLESFFKGVSAHEKGSQIWNNSLDESK